MKGLNIKSTAIDIADPPESHNARLTTPSAWFLTIRGNSVPNTLTSLNDGSSVLGFLAVLGWPALWNVSEGDRNENVVPFTYSSAGAGVAGR